ncbi:MULTISPECIES: hypothetical protein [unclassified Streptomyces]|uniref:hypothetical protein n=1 Tax=unclassified Streptomyces TaxID=2593676 RepID=UPI002024FACC|nr:MULTISPECIES: hypothetical protein [unclassified Streptomyces]WSC20655.1 hypothetical protein OIE60_13695 [Streptomyces sp. NBC_01766]
MRLSSFTSLALACALTAVVAGTATGCRKAPTPAASDGATTSTPAPFSASPPASPSPSPSESPSIDASRVLSLPHKASVHIAEQDGLEYGITLRTAALRPARAGLLSGPVTTDTVGAINTSEVAVLGSACTKIDPKRDTVLPLTVTLTGLGAHILPEISLQLESSRDRTLKTAEAQLEWTDGTTPRCSAFDSGIDGGAFPATISTSPDHDPVLPGFLVLKNYRTDRAAFSDAHLSFHPNWGLRSKRPPAFTHFTGKMAPDQYTSVLLRTITDGAKIPIA